MRRRPSSQSGGYSNNNGGQRHRRPGGSGGGHHHHNNNGNRPRKNYSAMREKYQNQARDAMASGDRVMAEYFYQHADHCYRMMVEEGQNNPRPQMQAVMNQQTDAHPQENAQESMHHEPIISSNTSQLPAFITATYEGSAAVKPVDPNAIQNWEERDA